MAVRLKSRYRCKKKKKNSSGQSAPGEECPGLLQMVRTALTKVGRLIALRNGTSRECGEKMKSGGLGGSEDDFEGEEVGKEGLK